MFSSLELTLMLLGSAVLGVVAFRMLHLPPMLGYLAVGIVIGAAFASVITQFTDSFIKPLLGVIGGLWLVVQAERKTAETV